MNNGTKDDLLFQRQYEQYRELVELSHLAAVDLSAERPEFYAPKPAPLSLAMNGRDK